jgi:SulP family sulfate permease
LPNIFAGAISGTLIVTFGISLAALVFNGDAARYLPAGIGILLVSSFAAGVIASFLSSYRPMISAPQDNTSVILSLMVAAIVEKAKPADAFPTIVAALGLTAVATGALFLTLGMLRLGKIVRFIPYPVVGGFLAGTGWLLVQGALSVLTGANLTFDKAGILLDAPVLLHWLPAFGFGVVLTLVLRRYSHFLVLPGLIVSGVVIFYVMVALSGAGVARAEAEGLLLGPFPEGALWPPLAPSDLARVDWGVLRSNAGSMVAVMVLAGISILLNASGLELATEEEIDLDRELRGTGVANLTVGALGGVVSYISLSESILNHKIGARSRAAGLICASLSIVTLLLGSSALSYFPKPVLGGVLLFLGFSFLVETVYDAWFRLPRGEYALVILILFVVVIVGFLEGVGVGIVISSVLFAVNYARIDVVKNAISGDVLRSKAARSAASDSLLQQMGLKIYILQLQGYIFFGTAYYLLKRVKLRLSTSSPARVRFILIDFRHVDGIDASAVVSFTRMRKLAEAAGVILGFTELPPAVKKQLERGGCIDEPAPAQPAEAPRADKRRPICLFSDLDHGLEWCEDQLLSSNTESRPGTDVLSREIDSINHHRELVARILGYLERLDTPAGFELFRHGERSNDLYLIESGELEAWIELADGRIKRLRTMGPGSVVGESALYLGGARSASVSTTRPSTLYRLTMPALERMTHEAPRLAASFHQFVAKMLAERLVNTTSAAQMVFY